MCEHCLEVKGNQKKKLPDQVTDRVLCGSRPKTKADCCGWRGTCCGGGCCESTSCCGGPQKSENNEPEEQNRNSMGNGGMMGGMGFGGYGMGGMGMGGYGMGGMGMGGGPRHIDDETVVCNMKRDKYCSGGECYLMKADDSNDGSKTDEKYDANDEARNFCKKEGGQDEKELNGTAGDSKPDEKKGEA